MWNPIESFLFAIGQLLGANDEVRDTWFWKVSGGRDHVRRRRGDPARHRRVVLKSAGEWAGSTCSPSRLGDRANPYQLRGQQR